MSLETPISAPLPYLHNIACLARVTIWALPLSHVNFRLAPTHDLLAVGWVLHSHLVKLSLLAKLLVSSVVGVLDLLLQYNGVTVSPNGTRDSRRVECTS